MRKLIGFVLCLFCKLTIVGQQPLYNVTPGNGNGLRFWNEDSYKIHMGNSAEYLYGPVQDYSIKVNMSGGTPTRGWTWGINGQTPVAAINALGNMQIAGSFIANGNVGIGITGSSSKLHVVGVGTSLNNSNAISGEVIVQSNTGVKSTSLGAMLEFVIPANSDGSNLWGHGRIITVAGSTISGHAAGKMILGTRRYWQKPGTSGSAWYYGDDLAIDAEGNLGVGTVSPSAKLNVYKSNSKTEVIIGNPSTSTGGFTSLLMGTSADSNGFGYIESVKSSGSAFGDVIINRWGGNVGIGTTAPTQKLQVKGTVYSTEVKVDLAAGSGPDYVFEPTYDLKPLAEIETYIKENKHLPEVPSAKEMEKNGVKLGEMNMLLLRKIEELTLYILDQNKEIEKLKERSVSPDTSGKKVEELTLYLLKMNEENKQLKMEQEKQNEAIELIKRKMK